MKIVNILYVTGNTFQYMVPKDKQFVYFILSNLNSIWPGFGAFGTSRNFADTLGKLEVLALNSSYDF